MKRPFEVGVEATLGIFVTIYYHMLIPGNQLSAMVSSAIVSSEALNRAYPSEREYKFANAYIYGCTWTLDLEVTYRKQDWTSSSQTTSATAAG